MDLTTPSTTVSNPALLLNQSAGGFGGPVDAEPITGASVHPLVLLSVLDHHTRRQEGAGRVIGTLLGQRDGNQLEITNCFAVPHAERGDDVLIGKDFNRQMLALHLRANPKETVVGWYATCDENAGDAGIAETSSLIHEFYAGECEEGDPVHVVVDTSLVEDSISLRAYKSTSVQVKNEPLAVMFHEIRLNLTSSESERICLDKIISSDQPEEEKEESQGDAPALQVSMERLLELLEMASDYVDGVVDGSIVAPDAKLGRTIADTLASVPRIRPEVFDRMFNDSLQDLLMVTYLSNITKTQLTIAEKLNATLGV
mmetsp:Transcript_10410/g.18971  ORF Transcript_10410/g.18971 Transcript_10410/m.18971 type:complete len:314 (-) Transcript_10410:684-1625(-)